MKPACIRRMRQPEVDAWGSRPTSDRATGARAATAMDRSDVAANPQVFRLLATVARALASNDNASSSGIGACHAPGTIERVCISIATGRPANASKLQRQFLRRADIRDEQRRNALEENA